MGVEIWFSIIMHNSMRGFVVTINSIWALELKVEYTWLKGYGIKKREVRLG